MPVTVKDVLAAATLSEAQVLAGARGVSRREVTWTTVIEWRGADFARRGEFVLTTGLGCDAERFEQFARQLAEQGAAAMCVTLHESGELSEVPSAVCRFADERGFPLIQVPWRLRFSEIMMAIIDLLIEFQYAAVLQEPDRLVGSFTSALLGGAGLAAIADALGEMMQRPVLILNSEFHVVASARADAVLDRTLDRWGATVASFDGAVLEELRRTFGGESPRQIVGAPPLGLGPGLVVASIARHRPLGYLYVAGTDQLPLVPTFEARALSHASIAVAMEMLRLRSAAEAESRVRGNFLWGLVTGTPGGMREVATNAVLLGYDLRAKYAVAVGVATGSDGDARAGRAEELESQLHSSRLPNATVARHADQILILLSRTEAEQVREVLEGVQNCAEQFSWGIADGVFALAELDRGYRQAMQALEVGAVVHGAGQVSEARSLGPYLILDVLARDDQAVQSALDVLRPILEYDRGTARELLKTLEVYLRQNGNTSAAARALYLNRHSLRYRLQKIEQLTGRSIEEYQDRFMLDMSLKLVRLVERRHSRSIAPADGTV